MSSYTIYKTLCDVIEQDYPLESYPNNKFKNFFIDIKVKVAAKK
ncbi:hypothetical protein [Priestia megaterium]|nr:hypothetical protein [Priestia megaterium]